MNSPNKSEDTVTTILKTLCHSSVRQNESCWRQFQAYLKFHPVTVVTKLVVMDFFNWLATSLNRAPATVSTHSAALADPLCFGLSITKEERALTLLKSGIRATTTPARRGAPQWSLHKILHYVTFDGISQLQEQHYLQRPFLARPGYRI